MDALNSGSWSPDCYQILSWNGKVPGGSGFCETAKIIWGRSLAPEQPLLEARGLPLWSCARVHL